MGESKEVVRGRMVEAMVRGVGKPPGEEEGEDGDEKMG